MKKSYCNPFMVITLVSCEDVIATSLLSATNGSDLEADWSSRVIGGLE